MLTATLTITAAMSLVTGMAVDTGVDPAVACEKCGKRRVIQTSAIYQPVDKKWLATGEWFTVADLGPLPREDRYGNIIG